MYHPDSHAETALCVRLVHHIVKAGKKFNFVEYRAFLCLSFSHLFAGAANETPYCLVESTWNQREKHTLSIVRNVRSNKGFEHTDSVL